MTETILGSLTEVVYQLQVQTIGNTELGAKVRKLLHVAVVLLGKGYGPDDEIAPLIEKYGRLSEVPDKRNRQ